jgi:hypothetical protein
MPSWVRIVRTPADHFQVIEAYVARITHLDLPCATANDAGDAIDLDVMSIVHPENVIVFPVRCGWMPGRIGCTSTPRSQKRGSLAVTGTFAEPASSKLSR